MMLSVLFIVLPLVLNYEFSCNNKSWIREPRIYLNERQVLAPTAHNFAVIVDHTDQVVSEKILATGTWEPQLIYLISKLIQPGNVILNLGAHVGLETILMGKLANGGKVYAFEPFSVSYRMLVKNVYLNDLAEAVICYRLAAGARSQQMRLKIDQSNTGHSYLFRGSPSQTDQFQTATVERVDAALPPSTVLDFALIDVEMHEVQALFGMREILNNSPNIIILLEWRYLSNPYRSQKQVQQLLLMLETMKFSWVRYKGGEQCKLGNFQRLESKQLYQIETEDILLVGPRVDLSKKFRLHQ